MNYTKGDWRTIWGDKSTMSLPDHANIYGGSGKTAQRICTVTDCSPATHEANANLIAKSPRMYEALDEILDITHNHATGISKYVDHQRYGNLVVYTPEQINRIGDLCRGLLTEGKE